MADSSQENLYLIIAAIDFGTTYSGYAFSTKPHKSKEENEKCSIEDIRMNKNWGSEFGCSSYKAPTCVLTGPDGKFQSFGFTAENDYSQKKNEGYNLYRHFKMMLMHEKKLTEDTTILSMTEHRAKALDIFAMALKYLKDHLLEAIKMSDIRTLEVSQIKWEITVPAIWKDSAKSFMRRACFEAGLISSIDSSQLVIALEPEAASILCRNISFDQFHDGYGNKHDFKVGEKYLIIDAGGGTLDISAHEILPSGNVKEICPPSGGPWGGICADKAFEQLFGQIFGEEFINEYKLKQPRDWLKLMMTFEKSKSGIKEIANNDCNISLSWAFGKEIGKKYEVDLDEFIDGKENMGISFNNGALCISSNITKGLFEPVIKDIVEHLKSLIHGGIVFDYVMLVGGFGQCDLLQHAVKNVFQDQAKLIIPLEAQLAIVKGAVMYAHQPSNIQSRIAPYSFGYNVTKLFNSEIHDPRYRDNFGGRELCTDLFKSVIKKGEEIKVNTQIKHAVGSNDYFSTKVEFYKADHVDVTYADATLRGVDKLGEITIHHDSDSFQPKKSIEIITEFGGTELIFKAKDAESQKWYETSINYFN